jgi:hypothetical protein
MSLDCMERDGILLSTVVFMVDVSRHATPGITSSWSYRVHVPDICNPSWNRRGADPQTCNVVSMYSARFRIRDPEVAPVRPM